MRPVFLAAVVVAACAPSSSAPSGAAHPAPPPSSPSPPTPSSLIAAIRASDAARVEELLRANPALADARSEQGTAAALVALLRLKDKEGFFRPQENAILAALLARRPALDRFEAAALGDEERARREIARDPGFVRARHALGWTPLHFAAFAGNLGVARALLDAGADVNAVAENPFRNTPLQVSILTEQVDLARLLLSRGGDVKARQEKGFTALHEAAQTGNRRLALLLLEAGADPAAAADDGRTPVDVAREKGNQEIAALLAGPPR